MVHQPDSLICFGTIEPLPSEQEFSAGPLTLRISDGAVRRLCWNGVEVVRGIACPIRDANWATCPSVLSEENAITTPDGFEIAQVRLVADGALRVALVFKGSSDGTFRATAEMSACREFITNRAGFTLLHPLRDVVGTQLSVVHPDGSIRASQFPLLISPDQVAGEISGLRHSVNGIDTEIVFRGEVFEMEDQRNWTDASFKTYCRPLSLPRPYRLNAGEIQRQEIWISVRGAPSRKSPAANTSPSAIVELEACAENVPRLAVAMEAGAIPDVHAQKLCRLLNPAILQLRVTPQTARAVCESAKSLVAAGPAEIELEIVIPSTDDPQAALTRVAADCKSACLAVARVLALPENYLQSYQPTGPWPAGPRPRDLRKHVRASFPDAQTGGGVLTYFPELNRCRPELCDYVVHGSTAITHASDDCSVLESLEGLSHVFKSGRALAQQRDYRLGLTAIGMRSNPYGSGVVENLRQGRVAMAGADPRQRGLFAAAWAVGAMAATQGHHVSSMALSAFVGPFGAIHRPERWAQPLYEEGAGAMVYPIFHVVRFLGGMGGASRLSLQNMGEGIVGVAARVHSHARLVLANPGAGVSQIRLPKKAQIRHLNAANFGSAIQNPEWLDVSDIDHGCAASLDPLSVAFLDMPL
jgi:D-apionolactonase